VLDTDAARTFGSGGVLETFLQMVNIVSACQPVPVNLSPDKSKVQNGTEFLLS
jgi:hypothetical protein